MEKDLKEIIKTKILNLIKKLDANNSNTRIGIKNFDEISHYQVGNLFLFNHPLYNKKDIEYLNDEEDADFLLFENNGVYINYSDELFTFHKISEEEKLVHVDLDNQEISSDVDDKIEVEEDLSEEITKKNDLVLVNYFPISISHSNLTINFDQNFSQVLSDEFILQVLQIFSIAKNSSLRCGYNSLGGGCIINHLHFEIIFLDDFNDIDMLPIEKSQKTPIFSTKFVNKNEEEISMFDENVLVILSYVSYPINAWKIEASEIEKKDADGSYQNSIANCVNAILFELIASEIPHNLIISDNGHTFFIIPRKFLQNPLPVNTCWNDLAGLITVKDASSDEIKSEGEIINLLNSVALSNEEFNSYTQKIVNKFNTLYILE